MSGFGPVGAILIVLLIAVMLWFALGTQRNVRRGNELLRWLQGGLPQLGKRTTMRWLGSSAIVLKIADAAEPFQEAEVVVVLEPRDVAMLWAWSRRRGRRDFVILRGRLPRAPRLELEAGDATGWTGEDRLRRLDEASWRDAAWGDDRVRASVSPHTDPSEARRAWEALEEVSGGVWRISVRREHPHHLEVHVVPPDLASPAGRLIGAFGDLGRSVLQS